jgi:GNAT superfamily N-acetyltransferase
MANDTISEARTNLQLDKPGVGRARLRRLDWDSDFFGDTMGVVEVEIAHRAGDRASAAASLLAEVVRGAREAGFGHVICRADGNDWPFVHGAQRAGWLIVDVATDLVCQPLAAAIAGRTRAAAVRDASPADLPALEEIAGSAFTYSRFAADPFFSAEQAVSFHRTWIRNLVNGLAQSVLVYEDAGGPAGFIASSLEGEESRIVLIASRAGQRSRGVGAALVDAGLLWARNAGAATAYVKTQAANVAALRLYGRAGFLPHRCEIALSANLRGTQAG